jgi:hypothetical protein
LASLFKIQAAQEEAGRRRKKIEEEADARARAEEEEERLKRIPKFPPLPPEVKMELTASALRRVLEKGQVDGFQFNVQALLKTPQAWPIIARMAKRSDVNWICDTLFEDIFESLVQEIAKNTYQELQDKLREEIDIALKSAYPLAAHLSPQEIRSKMRIQNRRQSENNKAVDYSRHQPSVGYRGGGGVQGPRIEPFHPTSSSSLAAASTAELTLESSATFSSSSSSSYSSSSSSSPPPPPPPPQSSTSRHVTAQLEGRGLLGRRLALIRRAHALMVDDFYRDNHFDES